MLGKTEPWTKEMKKVQKNEGKVKSKAHIKETDSQTEGEGEDGNNVYNKGNYNK